MDGIVVLVREYRESTGDQFNLVSEAQGPFSIWMSDCFFPFSLSFYQLCTPIWLIPLSPSRFTEKGRLSSTKYHFISPEILVFALQFSGFLPFQQTVNIWPFPQGGNNSSDLCLLYRNNALSHIHIYNIQTTFPLIQYIHLYTTRGHEKLCLSQ